MFKKILIANRGEIACRIAKTCKKLGIKTVAVYSDADAQAAHVAACDEAIHIGGSAPKDSYLCVDKIIDAAKKTGAQAIHPGYGFLSENENFALICQENSIVFIGPPVDAIRAMGSKSASKTLMETASVPLVPGYHGDEQDADFLQRQADHIGYPVLLKASAGGGGKGMRIVDDSASFKEALASCKREAISSFGDDKVLVEKYLSRPRHIEIQVFADKHGNCIYLFERDCSVQRRHQKVLEEAPAPGMSEELRRSMGQAAVDAAKAVAYEGAGTVEFIAQTDEHGNASAFYFMEMNTRLQVEHPVTEMITGQDLVEWQLKVASGQPLPLNQGDLRIHGHALEARIYAENPENQFLPSTGKLSTLKMPTEVEGQVRIDWGVREGDVISPFYDPMIAKLIVWGEDRDQALSKMSDALSSFHAVGPATNIAFLKRLVDSNPFRMAQLDTGLIARNEEHLLKRDLAISARTIGLLIAQRLITEALEVKKYGREENSPWQQSDGWLIGASLKRQFKFELEENQVISAVYQYQSSKLSYEGRESIFSYEQVGDQIRINLDGEISKGAVYIDAQVSDKQHLFYEGRYQAWSYLNPLKSGADDESGQGKLTAPMPGKVIAINVKSGDIVQKGSVLLVMEAMKMEHSITAPIDGKIDRVHFDIGDQVTDGTQLISFLID